MQDKCSPSALYKTTFRGNNSVISSTLSKRFRDTCPSLIKVQISKPLEGISYCHSITGEDKLDTVLNIDDPDIQNRLILLNPM